MGAVNCCEHPKGETPFNQGEIETKVGTVSTDRLTKTPKSHVSVNKPHLLLDKKSYHIVKIQSLLRAFLIKAKFQKRLNYQKQILHEFFKTQGVLCEHNDINIYVHPKVKAFEKEIKERKGIYSNENIPSDIMKPIEYKPCYSILMPCTYLIEKDDKLKGSEVETGNSDNILSENEYGTTILKRPIYRGYWNVNKKKNGYGILVNTDGSKYEGLFRNGKLDGIGRYITLKGDFFEGIFVQGLACGYGVFVHSDGNLYKGNWYNDLPWGDGEEWATDGAYYKGDFLQGKKCGIGEFKWKDGSIYLGGVKNDLLNGEGIYTWANGKRYKGMWKNNEMSGKGVLENVDGTKYEGDFFQNKKHGYGKYIYNQEKYFEGYWVNGKQHGNGRIVKNGEVEEGEWRDGKKVKN